MKTIGEDPENLFFLRHAKRERLFKGPEFILDQTFGFAAE